MEIKLKDVWEEAFLNKLKAIKNIRKYLRKTLYFH